MFDSFPAQILHGLWDRAKKEHPGTVFPFSTLNRFDNEILFHGGAGFLFLGSQFSVDFLVLGEKWSPLSDRDDLRNAYQKLKTSYKSYLQLLDKIHANICPTCRGEGDVKCRSCMGGEGYIVGEDCSRCHGHGDVVCKICRGRGVLVEYENVPTPFPKFYETENVTSSFSKDFDPLLQTAAAEVKEIFDKFHQSDDQEPRTKKPPNFDRFIDDRISRWKICGEDYFRFWRSYDFDPKDKWQSPNSSSLFGQ